MSSGDPPMWAVLGSIEFVILFVFTILLVRYYASKDSPLYANVIVVISWYLGFFGILFLPIDIAEAYYSIYYVTTNSTDTSGGGSFPNIDIGRGNASNTATFTPMSTRTTTITPLPTFIAATKSPLVSTSWVMTASPSMTWPSSSSTVSLSSTRSFTPSTTPTMGAPPSATSSPTLSRSMSSSPTITPSITPTISISPTKSRIPIATRTRTPSETPPAACFPYCGGDSGNLGGRRRALRDNELLVEKEEKGGVFSLSNIYRLLIDSATITSAPTTTNSSFPSKNNNSSSSSNNNTTRPGDGLVTEKALQIRNTQLEGFWVWVYWLTFFNTYILIPMVQEYVAAGEFTKWARVYAAFKINIIFYAVCGVFAFAALAYVVVGLNQGISDMMPVLISMSNTMGLVIIILLIGYGTAEVPRSFWIESDPDLDLRRNYFFAPELDSQLFDARSVLTDLLKKLKAFESKVAAMAADKSLAEKQPRVAQTVPELQRCLAIVNRKANFAQSLPGIKAPKKETPEQARRRMALEKKLADETADDEAENKANPNGSWFASIGLGSSDKYAGITLHALAKLHKKLMVEIGNLQKTQFLMDQMVVRCMMLEYIVAKVPPPVPMKKKTADGKTFYLTPKGSGISGAISPQFAQLQRSGTGNNNNTKNGRGQAITNNFSSKELAVPKTTLNGIPVSDAETDVLSERAGEALLSMLVLPSWFNGYINHSVWTFRMHAVPYVYKVIWLLCEIMSILLIWSEATIFLNLSGLVPVNLSIFGWFLHWADETGSHSYTAIQFAALVPLAYMCWCSTYTVFSLKLFGMMELYGNQNTDPYSMLVCASLFNRLQFSLAFNYLNVLMHSSNRADYPPTAFLNSVGAKMALSVIDWYLPIGIAVIYITCKLSVFNRALTMMGMEAHGEPIVGNSEHEGIIRTGMGIVSKGKRTLGLSVTPDGMSDDDFEKADEASRDRLRAIMLRAQARKEGKNPDDVARLDGGAGGGVGSSSTPSTGGEYSSGGYVGKIEGMSLNSFNSSGNGSGGSGNENNSEGASGGGQKPAPVKMGLAALASRAATNLAKNVGLPTNSTTTTTNNNNLDYGDDISSPNSPRAEMDAWRNEGRAYSNNTVDFSSSHLPVATVIVPPEPPTMAELLKGKRRL